jgi:hypothetical protein
MQASENLHNSRLMRRSKSVAPSPRPNQQIETRAAIGIEDAQLGATQYEAAVPTSVSRPTCTVIVAPR